MGDNEQLRAPVGTRDVLPPESARWTGLIGRFATHAGNAGYGLVQSPMFEDVAVFQRVGESTDVVSKEMYDFRDKGDRHIALRPEGTASVCRAFVQHRPLTPWKVWYAAPTFRYERPQAGRYRQHHQLGIEALGANDPDLDVEVIALAKTFLAGLGLRQVTLVINSLGTPDDRRSFTAALSAFLERNRDDLAPEDRKNIGANPLRLLDSKRQATREVTRTAPSILDHLSDGARQHFDRVQDGLGALGLDFIVEPRLVRGLDYYTHTTFELQAEALDAAQNTICGGGRYDGLVEALGGPPTPGIGFGAGIERILLACDAEEVFPVPGALVDVFVIDVTGGGAARDLTAELRAAGVSADRSFDGRSMKAQIKAADRSGARLALVVGDQELTEGTVGLRDLRSRDQGSVRRAEIVPAVVARLETERST
jgi:histidyl-tRNA synthetase